MHVLYDKDLYKFIFLRQADRLMLFSFVNDLNKHKQNNKIIETKHKNIISQ